MWTWSADDPMRGPPDGREIAEYVATMGATWVNLTTRWLAPHVDAGALARFLGRHAADLDTPALAVQEIARCVRGRRLIELGDDEDMLRATWVPRLRAGLTICEGLLSQRGDIAYRHIRALAVIAAIAASDDAHRVERAHLARALMHQDGHVREEALRMLSWVGREDGGG